MHSQAPTESTLNLGHSGTNREHAQSGAQLRQMGRELMQLALQIAVADNAICSHVSTSAGGYRCLPRFGNPTRHPINSMCMSHAKQRNTVTCTDTLYSVISPPKPLFVGPSPAMYISATDAW